MKTKLTHLREILLYQNAGLRMTPSMDPTPLREQSEPPEFNGLKRKNSRPGDHEFLDLLELKIRRHDLDPSGS